MSLHMHDESSANLPGTSKFPRDNFNSEGKPTSGRHTGAESKTPNDHDMSASQGENAKEIHSLEAVDSETPKPPNVAGCESNLEEHRKTCCSILNIDPALLNMATVQLASGCPRYILAIDKIKNISDGQLNNSAGEATRPSYENTRSGFNAAGEANDSNKNKLSASCSMRNAKRMSLCHSGRTMKMASSLVSSANGNDPKPMKSLNFSGKAIGFEKPETLHNVLPRADLPSSSTRNAMDSATLKRPFPFEARNGRREVGETDVNTNSISSIFKEPLVEEVNNIGLRSSGPLLSQFPTNSSQGASMMEIDSPPILKNNTTPDGTLASESGKSDFNQLLNQVLKSPVTLNPFHQTRPSTFGFDFTNSPLNPLLNPILPFGIVPFLSLNSFATGTTTTTTTTVPNISLGPMFIPDFNGTSSPKSSLVRNQYPLPNSATTSGLAEVKTANPPMKLNREKTGVSSSPSPTFKRARKVPPMNLTEYPCNTCGKSFEKAKHLDEHTKAEHVNYLCQVCHTKFTSFSNLKRHGVCHTNERPFKCPFCPTDYRRQDHLKRHMDTNHKDCDGTRETHIVVSTTEFLKFTQNPQRTVNTHVDHTHDGNVSATLSFSTQEENPKNVDFNHSATENSAAYPSFTEGTLNQPSRE